jgi:hypothetical protein
MRTAIALLLLAGLAAEELFAGPLLISEVLYDADGTDQGRAFLELTGPPDMNLAGYSIEGVNGAGGAITNAFSLDGVIIPADGFLVLADLDASGATTVPHADFGFAELDFQNGPDSIRLRFGTLVVDALGYGSFGGSLIFAGEGSPASDAPAGWSLARIATGLDTNRNSADFFGDDTPTPGFENLPATAVPTPEPSSLLLMGCGLLALRRFVRRRRGLRSPSPASPPDSRF